MSNTFFKVVIYCPFLLVKGFLLGLMEGSGKDFPYYFHRKVGIERETLGEYVRKVLHMECHTHVCLPQNKIPEFKQALEHVREKIDATVESERELNDYALQVHRF